jgi:hypothetical protein
VRSIVIVRVSTSSYKSARHENGGADSARRADVPALVIADLVSRRRERDQTRASARARRAERTSRVPSLGAVHRERPHGCDFDRHGRLVLPPRAPRRVVRAPVFIAHFSVASRRARARTRAREGRARRAVTRLDANRRFASFRDARVDRARARARARRDRVTRAKQTLPFAPRDDDDDGGERGGAV